MKSFFSYEKSKKIIVCVIFYKNKIVYKKQNQIEILHRTCRHEFGREKFLLIQSLPCTLRRTHGK